ncbi:hypothetical protein N9W09_03950 [Crocinitomicaceae bacterium]|nr:hypothetical protein [Crocinitomicaceae bacterium]
MCLCTVDNSSPMVNEYVSCFSLQSDYKSFILTMNDASVSLGYLMHFKHFDISRLELFYKKNTGSRQRSGTQYPVRRMRKKINRTGDLLHYLSRHQYDIILYDIKFSNGWRIKMTSNSFVTIYTNTQNQRNEIFDVIIGGFGFDKIPLNAKLLNLTYVLNYDRPPTTLGIDQRPDEFWSEAERAEWRKNHKY